MKKILILSLSVFAISFFSGCQKETVRKIEEAPAEEMQSAEIEEKTAEEDEWAPKTEMGETTLVETPPGFTARDINEMEFDTIVMWNPATESFMQRGDGELSVSPVLDFVASCVNGGGSLISPTSVFGGGSICSDGNITSATWPDFMEGSFVYGEVSNEKIEVKRGGMTVLFCDVKTKKCEEPQDDVSKLEKEKRGYASAVLFTAMQDIFYCHNKNGTILQPEDSLMGGGNMCSIELSLGGEKLIWDPVNNPKFKNLDEDKYSYGNINEDLISLNYQGSPAFCCKVKKGFCGGPELCE